MQPKLRIARPVTNPTATAAQWTAAFPFLVEVARFTDHAGFDGVMIGSRSGPYHFEFTVSHTHPLAPAPTHEDLVVFYLPDKGEWEAACKAADEAGFLMAESFNPYWDEKGRTLVDRDGYRVVLQCAQWTL